MRRFFAAFLVICVAIATFAYFSAQDPARQSVELEERVDADSRDVAPEMATEEVTRAIETQPKVPAHDARKLEASLAVRVLDETGRLLRHCWVRILDGKTPIAAVEVDGGLTRAKVPANLELTVGATEIFRQAVVRIDPLLVGETRTVTIRFEKRVRRVHIVLLESNGEAAPADVYKIRIRARLADGTENRFALGLRPAANGLIIIPLDDEIPKAKAWTLVIADWHEKRDRIWRVDRLAAPGYGITDLGARRPTANPKKISGRVVDQLGKPMAGIQVEMSTLDSTTRKTRLRSWSRSDERGDFAFRPATLASSVTLTIRAKGHPVHHELPSAHRRDVVYQREISSDTSSITIRLHRGITLEMDVDEYSAYQRSRSMLCMEAADTRSVRYPRWDPQRSRSDNTVTLFFPSLRPGLWTLMLVTPAGPSGKPAENRREIRKIRVFEGMPTRLDTIRATTLIHNTPIEKRE